MADESGVTFSWGGSDRGWSLLVHGGAGDVPVDARPLHVEGCRRAAAAGGEILRAGGSALDAVARAVSILEDDPCFNAGTGACLNAEGLIELDAAIMEGEQLRAGAVCALPRSRARSPSRAPRSTTARTSSTPAKGRRASRRRTASLRRRRMR